jgi:hypothetical protein
MHNIEQLSQGRSEMLRIGAREMNLDFPNPSFNLLDRIVIANRQRPDHYGQKSLQEIRLQILRSEMSKIFEIHAVCSGFDKIIVQCHPSCLLANFGCIFFEGYRVIGKVWWLISDPRVIGWFSICNRCFAGKSQ